MDRKQIVFVLGMGRSGTSALARVLSLCGGLLPKRLLEAHESNPKGHWEPLEALQVNDAFLHRRGSTWYDPTLRIQDAPELEASEREAFVDEIRALLRTWLGEGFLVIKEPRIAALTEFWFDAARREALDIKVVIPVRHPDEVSASLAARDRMSGDLSKLLWLKYNLLAERESRSIPRVFVEYSNLLGDWRREIARIALALEIDLSRIDEAGIEDFLARDLYRERRPGGAVEDIGPFRVGKLYSSLSAAAQDLPLDSGALDGAFEAYRTCDRVVRAFEEFRTRFGPTPPIEARLAAVAQERDTARLRLSEQETLIADQARTLAEQEEVRVELMRRSEDQAVTVENLRREHDALSVAVKAEHARFEQERAAWEERRARAEQQASELRGQLQAVWASSSWRVTRPLRTIRYLSQKLRSLPATASRPQ